MTILSLCFNIRRMTLLGKYKLIERLCSYLSSLGFCGSLTLENNLA